MKNNFVMCFGTPTEKSKNFVDAAAAAAGDANNLGRR
jgi:hypothetical protein